MAGRCLAKSSEIETVLFEVVPPMVTSSDNAPSISSVRYLTQQTLPEVGSDFAHGQNLKLELRPIARVTGEADFAALDTQCLEDAKEMTLHARFTPSEQLLGLSGTSYTSDATLNVTEDFSGKAAFNISVPPGYYDIYLQTEAEGCHFNPRLFRRRAIGVVSQETTGEASEPVDDIKIPLSLAKPAELEVDVSSPQSESLTGWNVALIDGNSGSVISTQEPLLTPVDGSNTVTVKLLYSSVDYPDGSAPVVPAETEILRLSPPSGVVAPTLYASRVGLELFEPNKAQIVLDGLPSVVSVVGQVLLNDQQTLSCYAQGDTDPSAQSVGASGPCEVPFNVQIVSSGGENETSTFNDTIPKGVIATYQTAVDVGVDSERKFQVDLPVGEYRAIAVPTIDEDRPWAIGEGAWVLGGEDREVHGKTVDVRPRSRVSGRVVTQGSANVQGFAVRLLASPRESGAGGEKILRANTVLELTRRDNVLPRATSAVLSESGEFSVFADPGVFDLSVRPDPESGFAWLVQPNMTVLSMASVGGQGVRSLRLPLPVRYAGQVTSYNLGGSVADALIRAYAYLDADGSLTNEESEAYSVIQIAEMRADSDGRFDLLLPAQLNSAE